HEAIGAAHREKKRKAETQREQSHHRLRHQGGLCENLRVRGDCGWREARIRSTQRIVQAGLRGHDIAAMLEQDRHEGSLTLRKRYVNSIRAARAREWIAE